MRRGSLLVAALSVAVGVGGCGDGAATPEPEVDARALRIDGLNEQMDAVARAQDATAPELRAALTAIRELDRFVAGMRDPATVRATRGTWPQVDAAFQAAAVGELREPLIDLARRVDRARASLARAREAVPSDWERAYLDAEDEVLRAVRSHAEATDALVQVVQRSWPTYQAVHATSAEHVEANERYRSAEEAVQAYEVRVGRLIGPLGEARSTLRSFLERQAEAATAVNEASAAAAEVWRGRPSPLPADASGP